MNKIYIGDLPLNQLFQLKDFTHCNREKTSNSKSNFVKVVSLSKTLK